MTDCIIIGAGIIGLMTARELALAGQQVTVLDRQQPARESTWAGGGIISPLYPWRYPDSITALASWSQARYESIARAMHDNGGLDPEFLPNGLLIVAPQEEQRALDWSRQHQRRLERVGAADIRRIEPSYQGTAESALWMPGVTQLRNPRLAKSLLADVLALGVKVLADHEVLEFDGADGEVRGLTTNQGKLQAERYCVCAGAWTGRLLQQTGVMADVGPVKGQMILFRGEPGTIQRMMLEDSRYVIPRRDGRVLFGSSLEYTEFDRSTSASVRKELRQIAVRRFPVLADLPVEHHWAGLRPGSPNGIPYIGRHPELGNLFFNAGQFRNGVVLAPASCRLAADLILERPPILPPEPYALQAPRD